MSKKVLFGFDYTNNEFVKIILYLSAAAPL